MSMPLTVLRPLLPAAAVLPASLLVSSHSTPRFLRILLPAAAAGAVGLMLGSRNREAAQAQAALEDRMTAAEARVTALIQEAAEMRHDLRGILSPALLTADRLAMSQDPASKRAGEAMISTVERAEERLRRS